MRLTISFAALFLSIIFLQLSSGALGPLDALGGLKVGFSANQIGLLGSAHFAGFFIGCWMAPRLMEKAGHIRAFAAFAAMGAIGILAHPIIIGPLAWSLMRVATGFAIAGCYTVAEAWLQAKLTNETRGRSMGTYRLIDLGASLVAQVMIGVLEPASYVSYNLLAIFCCAALLPLMLTTSKPPETFGAPRLRPLKAIRLSPLAAAGVITAGMTFPAFRMVGPIYGQTVGLTPEQIGLFLATALLGGAVAQYPVGWLADRIDRRQVLLLISALSVVICGLTAALTPSITTVFALSFFFGMVTLPVFSISAAHANDFATPDFIVELSAALMFLYALGAIVSPLLASSLMTLYGPGAMFLMIAAAHFVLVVFGLYRMTRRASPNAQAPYTYVPRTSFVLGWLLRRR